LLVRKQTSTQRVGTGYAGFESHGGFRSRRDAHEETLEPFKLLDRTEAARRTQFTRHLMFPSLIMRRGTKTPWRSPFQFDSFHKSVKGQIEIQPSLFPVRNDIQPSRQLIVQGYKNGVFLKFSAIGFTELS
jgi:hypothetical protein